MAKGAWVCKLVLFATTMTNELTAMNPTMPRWLLWSVLALLSWGVWAIMAKLIGEALSGAHNQALSTLGVLPIMLAIGVSKRVSPPGNSCWQSEFQKEFPRRATGVAEFFTR